MASVLGEASSSSPSSTSIPPGRLCTYHVFLSFNGQDTRKGFTDHLCTSLERKGIITYRDDKNLEKGEVIKDELLKAIEESMFAIAVLSPNYASSTWCLDELQKIVECSKSLGLSVVPVFYTVEPADVRYQRGSFEEAFRKHQQRFGQESEKIKRWRNALTQVANYSGWDSKNQLEARLVESIVEDLYKKLIPKLSSCTKNRVGVSSRVKEVIKLIGIPGIQLNNVHFIGIWGMGGIGKTTIARAVFEAIRGEFKFCCFLRNVRELHEKNDLVHLQKRLLSCLHISTSDIDDIEDGKNIIKTSLCNKEVLIVLDDVSEVKQLESLAENEQWFGEGSRIIITTRDKHLLNVHGVHETYEVEELDNKEASHLFCLKSFRQPEPKEGYLELSKVVVKYTKGLPLAVEVLGSYLYGRNDDFWQSTVKEIRSGPPPFEISKALRISYNHLTPIEQNIFLDIACFFKGEDKDEVTRILKMCDYCVGIGSEIGTGIVTLIDKSLLTVDQYNNLEMHDLLQEMGKHIIYEESPNNPGKRSRLWSRNDIDRVLINDMGTEKIQGIVLRSNYDARWSLEAFSKMSQLKLLILPPFRELLLSLNYLPTSLKVLHWEYCFLETLPLTDQAYEVVEMKLQHSNIKQLWHGKKFLEKLKHLDLSYSVSLKQTPDLTGAPNLETFILEDCDSLTEVHPSLVHHKNLLLLNLSGCKKLETLPSKLEMHSLKELIIEYCKKIENPPEFGECMKKLSKLSSRGTRIRELPMSLGCLVGLEYLSLYDCFDLVCLPDAFDQLKSLKELNVGGCYMLRRLPPSVSRLPLLRTLYLHDCELTEGSFPHDFCHCSSLVNLYLSSNRFISMPISIHKLPKLRCLSLNHCYGLQFLPKLPSSIRELEASRCYLLSKSESNILSTVYNVFKSPNTNSQDRARIFRMMISGKEIPTWFVHRQDGNRVSVPNPHNCPRKDRMGIALCFLLHNSSWISIKLSLFHNGNKFITRWNSYDMVSGYYLYILCLTNDYLGDEFHEDNRFELSIKDCGFHEDDLFDDSLYDDNLSDNDVAGDNESRVAKILKSTARWVRIEDLNKSGTEGPKKKRQKVLRLEQKH